MTKCQSNILNATNIVIYYLAVFISYAFGNQTKREEKNTEYYAR